MRSGHYRQYARDCLQLANGSSDPSYKAVLLDMAVAWIRLSEQVASLYPRRYGHLTLVSDNENSLVGDALLPERQAQN